MTKFPWRSLLYAAVLGYILLDLKVFNGPLKQSFTERQNEVIVAAKENQWVAIVNREPITRDQLDLAVSRHLYQRGKGYSEIPAKNLTMIRRAALQSLINDTLVRHYADGENYFAPKDEIDSFVEEWETQFASESDLEKRSQLQSLPAEERRRVLARIWSRKRWLEQRIEPGVNVTDEEVRQWFEANRETGVGFVEPEKLRARQIFISTVETDDEEHKQLIHDIHHQITEQGKPFEEIAKEMSEDPRTAANGGDLNWFAKDRVPEKFAKPVFALKKGQVSKPFKTDIGWHIVELTDLQPEKPVEFEQVADEIRFHLETERSADTIKQLIKKLRTVANILLFPEHI